jgi:hypothetical protein
MDSAGFDSVIVMGASPCKDRYRGMRGSLPILMPSPIESSVLLVGLPIAANRHHVGFTDRGAVG